MTLSSSNDYFVYVGAARGDGEPEGIYVYRLDMASGNLRPVSTVTDVHNPSFLAVHPNGRVLYSIDEDRSESPSVGAVSAYAIDPATGELTYINRQESHGEGLAHLSTDNQGRFLLTAHYGGGSISVLPILADGSLGEATEVIQHSGSGSHPRQDGPHPHSIYVDPADNFVFVPDLGLDKVMIYRLDAANGKLVPNDTPWAKVSSESGPRHFAFHTNGRFAYVINELASTITAFNYDSDQGALTEIQTVSTLPEGYTQESLTAEILVHPTGKFVYGSNRGHDSIAIFSVDEATGALSAVGHEPTQGGHPRNFAIDPTGTYLFAENRDNNNIVVFRIHPDTGLLQATGHVIEVPRPVCIKMVPVSG